MFVLQKVTAGRLLENFYEDHQITNRAKILKCRKNSVPVVSHSDDIETKCPAPKKSYLSDVMSPVANCET